MNKMLEIEKLIECYPNCDNCPGGWFNRILDHKITCDCCKLGHVGIKRKSDNSVVGQIVRTNELLSR